MPDYDDSLGDQNTFDGSSNPADRRPQSIGDEVTLGGDSGSDEGLYDDDMEVVDLEFRYTTEGTLGKGGMGEVLLATDTRLNRKVAIKRILGSAARSKTAVNRFLTEAQSIAALNHPNIVQIYDYGRANDGPFLIMEYVQGSSLFDKCREGAIPVEEAIELACQLCDGLEKAHAANIVHRDIKPANVLLTPDGVPKLTDFGLAKAETADTGMTMAGAMLGTLDFMPPEQRRDAAEVDARSDLWALAATFYQMVTGKSPKIIKLNDLPDELHEVLGKALEDGMADRYQTAVEFRDALRLCLVDTPESVEDLGEGECPHCGTRNEPSRRFCRSCAKSLEVECLSCSSGMPAWESVCGRCGERQEDLADDYREKMADQKTQAERALDKYEYDRAILLAQALGNEDDLRFQHLSDWSVAFLEEIESHRNQQIEKIDQQIDEALKHEEESDFSSALRALEKIPVSLRHLSTPKHSLTAMELIANYEAVASDIKSQDQEIRKLVKSQELDGLIEKVERLKMLQPKRTDLNKLLEQLLAREEKLNSIRDEAYQQAVAFYSDHQYRDCLRQLHRIHPLKIDGEIDSLQQQAKQDLARLKELRQQIKESVAVTNYDGLLYLIDEFLVLDPSNSEILKLREQLILKEQEHATLNAEAVRKASGYFEKCKFAKAVETLEAVPENSRDHETLELLSDCQFLWDQQRAALEALNDSIESKEFTRGHAAAELYFDTVAKRGFNDVIFGEVFADFEIQYANCKRELLHLRRRKVLKYSSVIGASLLLVTASTIYLQWAATKQKNISDALSRGDFNSALKLDPANSQALALRKEAEDLSDAIKRGDYELVLKLDPKNIKAIALQKRATEISEASSRGDYVAVLKLDPSNAQALALKASDLSGAIDREDYRAALAIDPMNGPALVLKKKADISRALHRKDYKSALALDPNNAQALELKNAASLANALNRGDYDRALKLDPRNSRALAMKIEDSVVTVYQSSGSVPCIAFSPDGSRIALGGKRLSIAGGFPIGTESVACRGHKAAISCVAFNPDGNAIVSGSGDGTLLVSDTYWGKEKMSLKGHPGSVYCVVFSPSGKSIVSGGSFRQLIVWNSQTGEKKLTLDAHSGPVYCVNCSYDGKNIVSGSSDRTLKIWDAQSGKDVFTLKGHSSAVNSVAYSPDSETIVSGSDDGTLKIWDAQNGREKLTINGHSNAIKSVAFSFDGNNIVSGSDDGTLKIWDAKTGKEMFTLKGHVSSVNSVAFSPDGQSIASSGRDKTVKIWDVSAFSSR